MARGQGADPRPPVKPHPFLTPEAEADLDGAFEWYEDQLLGLGDEFMAAVEQQFERILENPRLYQVIHGSVKRALTRRFPYAIYYLLEPDAVVVLGVLHQARDPEQWKQQL